MSNLKSLNKDQLMNMVKELKEENTELRGENDMLKTQLEEIKSQLSITKNTSDLLINRIINLERRQSAQEQYSRRECLEFSGIPSTINDNNLEDKVREILKKIDVDISPRWKTWVNDCEIL